ncbi:MAG: DUF434 domain-containing protein [Planctomycetota bacterium]|nr:DUF434 domain-containing protein [Planctomycetota bacterium]
MPDKRKHRGAAPGDDKLFSKAQEAMLATAVDHLSWLFDHGYAENASLKLVGDRFSLLSRQRTAIRRCAAPQAAVKRRIERQLSTEDIAGKTLHVDGFNLLTTIEVALSRGVLFLGRDQAIRDMASMHGSYRKVQETLPAFDLIASFVSKLGLAGIHWYFDKPVSNAGRLSGILRDHATTHEWGCPLEVSVVPDPDRTLIDQSEPTVSADRLILDEGPRWFNLAHKLVESLPDLWLLDLSKTHAQDVVIKNN